MGKIGLNYLYNLVYQIIVLFVPLFTAPYLARVLGPEGNGIFSYVHSWSSLLSTIVLLGIYNYGNRQVAYVRDNKNLLNLTFWRIMSARVVLMGIGTITYLFVVFFLGKYYLMFTLYYTYILAYFVDCTWLYVGLEDMKWAVLKNVLTKTLVVIGIFVFVKESSDLWIFVLLQGVCVLVSNILAYTQLSQYVNKPMFDLSNVKNDIVESAKLFLPGMAIVMYMQMGKILLGYYCDIAQVSFYDYSEKIVMIPLSFITVLSTVMMPRIANEYAKKNREAITALLNKAFIVSLFLACPMVFGITSIAEDLIPWYLGDKYIPTISVIYIMSPLILANTILGVSGTQYFTATNRIDILNRANIIALFTNVVLNFLLIRYYEVYGAAISLVVTCFVNAEIQYYYLSKEVKLINICPVFLRYFIYGALMFCSIKCVSFYMNPTPVNSLLQIVIGVTFYFCLCYFQKDPQLLLLIDKVKKKL